MVSILYSIQLNSAKVIEIIFIVDSLKRFDTILQRFSFRECLNRKFDTTLSVN